MPALSEGKRARTHGLNPIFRSHPPGVPSAMFRLLPNLSLLFTDRPFLERFFAARKAGFSAVEFQFPYAFPADLLAKKCHENALEVALFNLPAGNWEGGDRGLACLPDRQHAFREGVMQAIDYAKALGCKKLNALAGLAPAGISHDVLETTLLENLDYAALALEKAGLTLLVEVINSHDVPGFFLDQSNKAEHLIQRLNRPNLRIQYDFYHAFRMNEPLPERLVALLPLIGHIQVADGPGRHEPGSGELPFMACLDALKQGNYQGDIGLEYHPKADTESGLYGFLAAWTKAGGRV
jgi:hydroxypyruvate isomerase